jgi:hypothetical protein
METKHITPSRWAIVAAGALAAGEIVAQPLLQPGLPLLANLCAVLALAAVAWRRWPFRPDGSDN